MSRKILILTLAACMLLCGCKKADSGAAAPQNETKPQEQNVPGGNEIVGADWRTWGTIDEYGTLNIDGSETEVCACVFADRVELYYNEASQNLYKTIEYPEKLTSEQYNKANVSFEDFNGNGNTDVRVTVEDASGTELWWTWVWDTDDFVYMAALAYPPKPVNAGLAFDTALFEELYHDEIVRLYTTGAADRFALVDVDGDEIPELAASSSEGSWDKDQIFLYTIYNGAPVLLTSTIGTGMEGHYIGFYAGENVVECSGAAMGDRRDRYAIKDGKLEPILSLQWYNDPTSPNGETVVYFVDEVETDLDHYREANEAFTIAHGLLTILETDQMRTFTVSCEDGWTDLTEADTIPYVTYEDVMGGEG